METEEKNGKRNMEKLKKCSNKTHLLKNTDQQLTLQPPKDNRPVSSMSSTGSATSGDSGCFGEQSSPVNFAIGEECESLTPESSPLPQDNSLTDFLPLSPSAMQSFFAANGKIFDKPTSGVTNQDTSQRGSDSPVKLEASSRKASENPILQMHHYRQQAKQAGVLANSSSSPCLFGFAAAAAKKDINSSKSQKGAHDSSTGVGDDGAGIQLPLPFPNATPQQPAVSQFSMAARNTPGSAAASLSDLTQYINPEIHSVRMPSNAAPQQQADNSPPSSSPSKNNRQDAYKTVMCQAWLESTKCSFGDNCKFAHGETELRPAKTQSRNNNKYKTKLCDKYTTTGICPYGNRCLFIHPPPKNGGTTTPSTNGAEGVYGNAPAFLSSAVLLSSLNRFEGTPRVQNNANSQLDLLRKLLAAQQQQQFNSSAFMAANFPPLPNSYSMPSLFAAVGSSGFKNSQSTSKQQQDKSSPWSQIGLEPGDQQDVYEADGEQTPNGGRPHPSWPLEPPTFYNDRRSSCDFTALAASFNIQEEHNDNDLVPPDVEQEQISHIPMSTPSKLGKTVPFGSRFHHQSMPLFNLPNNFQQTRKHHPSTPQQDSHNQSAKSSGNDLSSIIGNGDISSTVDSSNLDEFPPLPGSNSPALLQRSSTNMSFTSPANPANAFRPLRKKFSNGVLHSVTPTHSHYSSNSSCSSCSTSSSMYLNGAVGRDILAEIWSTSVDSTGEEDMTQRALEIPPSLADDGQNFMQQIYGGQNRHILERDETLRETDVENSTTASIDELSRQMELQKLGEFLIASSETYASECLESEKEKPLPDFFTGQEETGIRFAGIPSLKSAELDMHFEEFTDFDDIPALKE
ncbi:zinc finger c-x8-C-x5-C-x3-H type (and similar) domain-containing protein [Ditylenchus destructor]|uniref:Zinc finger c-x8-C-x5-C-x3-H type (And similar) domain-containing protein n=1 Tax=Ditylenchus destructor TaxID=166010 RepID=A0AAD4RCV7_9BILA|nr:zinc finger c-x8-C-x5-C-x3-H type (and similar) domain-containing protein [Ditylenchus destructor]